MSTHSRWWTTGQVDPPARLALVTAPTDLPVHLNELKAHLRIPPTENLEDALILAYLRAAVSQIDGRDGWLGRALCTQTWDYILEGFPRVDRHRPWGEIRVPLPPLQSVTSITYTDENGDNQTLAASKYFVSGISGSKAARIAPAFGETWPTTRDEPDTATVRFVAGYGTFNDIPDPIKSALFLMVSHLYENREQVVIGQPVVPLPMAADALLAPYRVWSVG